jgi:hypothetical protein
VPESHETTEADDGVSDPPRQLIDDEMVDLTNVLSICSVDFGPMDVFAGDTLMVWMCGCASHDILPWSLFPAVPIRAT